MKATKKTKGGLDKKFKKVLATPEGFSFYEAIHDFIEHIEVNASLSGRLLSGTKQNKELNIAAKYSYLKQIYQGLEDADNKSDEDFGHTRYAVLIELNKIRNKDVSESNSFWKKRALLRKLTGEIYERLN